MVKKEAHLFGEIKCQQVFWGTQGLNIKCQIQKWKAGRADAAQKVGGATPRARAWLRPWRSAWTRAAAAGGVWGHEQMSFTTSTAGLLLLLSWECSFQELPSSSQTLTCNLGTHRGGKKLNYKTISNMEMLFGLTRCHAHKRSCVAQCALPSWGIHFTSSIFLIQSADSCTSKQS